MPAVEVSWGELLDKVSILEIKAQRIEKAASLANVRRELEHLRSVLEDFSPLPTDVDRERAALRATNEEMLWDLKDAVRACEPQRSFDASFVERARKIYALNDRRASIKKQINILMNSTFIAEKEYRCVEEIRNRN
jgi:hypothetical protein